MNRTLVDLADVVRNRRRLAKAVHEADVMRRLDLDEIFPLMNGRRGARRLKLALAGHRPADLRSDNEFDALYAVTSSDLPVPQTNVVIATEVRDFTVDLLWPRERLIVEIDGAGHRSRRAFEEDRVRDSQLTLCGYRVVRVTRSRLRNHTREVLGEIADHLARGA